MKNFRRLMAHSFRIGVKDLVAFARDRMMLVSFIIMPIFMMVMIGFIFPSNTTPKNAPLAVINLDQGPLGAQVVNVLNQPMPGQTSKIFELSHLQKQDDAIERIKDQTIQGAVVIPVDFSAKVESNEQAKITMITDQSNPQVSAEISGVLDVIMSGLSTQLAVGKVASMPGAEPGQAMAIVQPFTIESQSVVPGKPNYFQFMAPGLMAMTIMMAAMTGLAASISRERELGTLDGILSAPISRLSIVLGKSFAQGVRGILQALLTLLLAVVIFGVVIQGSPWLLALLLLLTVFSFIGIGIIISAMAKEQESATIIMMTLTFPMLFLSGALFPIQQMPTVMQWISKFLPLTYSVDALRKCMVLGTSLGGMSLDIWVMLGLGIVFTAIAIPIFSRVITR